MKIFKKIICFMLMFVSVFMVVACSSEKNENPPADPPGTEQGGGGGSEQPEAEEVFVPYTSSDVLSVGAEFVEDFFLEFDDIYASVDFEGNIVEMKSAFFGASDMLDELSKFENLIYGRVIKGKSLTLSDYSGNANVVSKFLASFVSGGQGENSTLKVSLIFAYNGLNSSYNYDFYDFVIVANKSQKIISCDIAIERSVASGASDSTAKYYNIELDGVIGGGFEDISYNCCQFERTEIIESTSQASSNNIDKFKQSKFSNKTKKFVGVSEAEILLRTPTSEPYILVNKIVGGLNAKLRPLSIGSATSTLAGLSEKLVPCAFVNAEII